jgi:hypothetical protein
MVAGFMVTTEKTKTAFRARKNRVQRPELGTRRREVGLAM